MRWAKHFLRKFDRFPAYNYIERGYDVYLINCRGDRYSEQHTTLNSRQSAFWNFTWQEMARYDLPETITAILERTGSTTIQCAGHSQGATIILALLATQPHYNQIITHAGLFAPFTFMNRVGFPISTVLNKFYRFDYHRYRQFVPHNSLSKITAHTICKIFNGRLCNLLLNFVLGPSLDKLDGVSSNLNLLFAKVNVFWIILSFISRIWYQCTFATFQPVARRNNCGILVKKCTATILVKLSMLNRPVAQNQHQALILAKLQRHYTCFIRQPIRIHIQLMLKCFKKMCQMRIYQWKNCLNSVI